MAFGEKRRGTETGQSLPSESPTSFPDPTGDRPPQLREMLLPARPSPFLQHTLPQHRAPAQWGRIAQDGPGSAAATNRPSAPPVYQSFVSSLRSLFTVEWQGVGGRASSSWALWGPGLAEAPSGHELPRSPKQREGRVEDSARAWKLPLTTETRDPYAHFSLARASRGHVTLQGGCVCVKV